jgi:CHAT domain-containing protein/Tfp pilus assembly protein PilF
VLEIFTAMKNKADVGNTLNNIGGVYADLGQYQQALSNYQQALSIAQELGQRAQEANSLSNIGNIHSSLGNYDEALKFLQQALKIRQEIRERPGEMVTLNNIGYVHHWQGRYDQALEVYQQARAIAQKIGDRDNEATSLGNIGIVYSDRGNYAQAMSYQQQALEIRSQIGDRAGQVTSLINIGVIHFDQGRYPEALKFYQQALILAKELDTRQKEATALNNIGTVYAQQSNFFESMKYFQQALAINREIGNRSSEAVTLRNIAIDYGNQGEYAKALELLQQALSISQAIGDNPGQANYLNSIGFLYSRLGQYPQALEYRKQALGIAREIGSRPQEVNIVLTIGVTYRLQKDYAKAEEQYRQSLTLAREIGSRANEGYALGNLGYVYERQGNQAQALESLQQALAIFRNTGDRYGEGFALGGLGLAYQASGRDAEALKTYQQAIAIQREIGDREGEAKTLSDLGKLLAKQNQPELAIAFYKQSVNTTEGIRKGLRSLAKEQQESYTETVAETYRNLADLLLKRDRVLEAQQVLDLLKVQELEDYLRTVRGAGQALTILRPEEEILKKFNALQQSAIALGQELVTLEDLARSGKTLTPEQQKRKEQLIQVRLELNQQFTTFTQQKDVVALLKQLTPAEIEAMPQVDDLRALGKKMAQLDAVMLYPLVLDDRLELIITAPNAQPLRRTVKVSRQELNAAIVEFRQALQDPQKDASAIGQKLYGWVIQPLEKDLQQAKATTIIYAPDGQLRYIPLAALHDGKQWLVQRYRINNITSRSIDDLTAQPHSQPRVLAGAFGSSTEKVTVAGQNFTFPGLAFAGKEVETLATLLPKTSKLLDQAFTPKAIINQMNEYTIVHLATHAALVPNSASFIVFGNGETATLQDIENWTLDNVDLVVLSACETGLGGKLGRNGEEVLGLGYQFTKQDKAKAAIASLWQVDDGGTQALMVAFYGALQAGKPKAAALREAQMALIDGTWGVTGSQRSDIEAQWRSGVPANVIKQLNHPYYWAPFILIGNGL